MDSPPNPRKADDKTDAVAVSQWHNSKAIVIGNEAKEEWIIAPNSYSLEMMR